MAKPKAKQQQAEPPVVAEPVNQNTNEAYVSELQHIAAVNDGVLQARAVVEFARNPETALHARFEWDDTKAGESYRLFQARNLIRVSVQWLGIDTPKRIRAFVSLRDDRKQDGGGYRTTVNVMTDTDRRAHLLAEALMELQGFRRKYAELSELAQVFGAIESLLKTAA